MFLCTLLYISAYIVSISFTDLFFTFAYVLCNSFVNRTNAMIWLLYIQVLNARRPSFFVTIDSSALIQHSTAMASTTAKTFPMNRTVLVNKQKQTYFDLITPYSLSLSFPTPFLQSKRLWKCDQLDSS